MKAVLLSALLLLVACSTPAPVLQEPVIITVPEYLLVTPSPTQPPDESKFVELESKQQVEALSAVLRSVYTEYAFLITQIKAIADRQKAMIAGEKPKEGRDGR